MAIRPAATKAKMTHRPPLNAEGDFLFAIDKDRCQCYSVFDKNHCHFDRNACQKGDCRMPLHNRLKEHRARLGVNQQQMGVLAGVSRQTISQIERGDYSPSVTLALKLAKICQVTVEDIFSYEEDENHEAQ